MVAQTEAPHARLIPVGLSAAPPLNTTRANLSD